MQKEQEHQNDLLLTNMSNLFMGNPNQYVFQPPNDFFVNPPQENFFFNNNNISPLDYNNIMNGFPSNFMAAQPHFNPNEFLNSNNIILANNNLMLPNNLSLGPLNGNLIYLIFEKKKIKNLIF